MRSMDQFFQYKFHDIRVVSDGHSKQAFVYKGNNPACIFEGTSLTEACEWIDRQSVARLRADQAAR